MTDETVVILGIPIDNVTMEQAIERIMAMIDAFQEDHISRLVATVNVDFLVNTLSWFSQKPRHPELLNILRQAHLVTADGMPIVWISRLLGAALKERVTGADLVPRLAQEASLQGKSIYFLGGMGDVGHQAAEILKKRYPALIVAGADAPFVSTVGEQLTDARDEDAQIVNRINRSKADILLVAFGNPKQEVWFERNRLFLQVPVTIGIGGTFDFIAGSVTRAPGWMQKTGLEWIFRLTQDPKRLLKRYAIGFFKFGLMVLPVLGYYSYRRLLFNHLHGRQPKKPVLPETSVTGTLTVQTLLVEDPLDAAKAQKLSNDLKIMPLMGADTIIDLSRVSFVDSSGIGFLLKLWNNSKNEDRRLHLAGMQPSVNRTFKLSRIHDLFAGHIHSTTKEALQTIRGENKLPAFQMEVVQTPAFLLLRFSGTLDALQASKVDISDLLANLGRRHCALDLTQLSFVDSSGLMIFLKLHRHVTSQGCSCWVGGAAGSVRQMFKITKIERLLSLVPDVDEIVANLENN